VHHPQEPRKHSSLHPPHDSNCSTRNFAPLRPAPRPELLDDNTSQFTGSRLFTQLQIGDEVNLAGTSRTINKLVIGLSQQGLHGTGDLQTRIYANDGSGGLPATVSGNHLQLIDLTTRDTNNVVQIE